MAKLRIWIAATIAWMLIFFSIERFHEPLNLASFVYVLASVAAIVVVALQRRNSASLGFLLLSMLCLHLGLKATLGYQVFGTNLPITVTEACALLITVLLAQRIAACMDEFEEGATDVMTMHLGSRSSPFESGQADLYREIRRARQFKRRASVLAMTTDGTSTSVALNRLIEEVQHNALRRYIDARIGKLLSDQTKDCDIIAFNRDHFVVLLPEASLEHANRVSERLQQIAHETLGLRMQIGTATFPEQEVTLTGLLSRAENEMRSASPTHHTLDEPDIADEPMLQTAQPLDQTTGSDES